MPGGGVNLNKENCDEAVIREIREETGLEVKNVKKAAWDTDIEPIKNGMETYYIFLQYICEHAGGELRAGGDMHHFEWVDVNNLSNYNLNKPTRILLQKLGFL
ncbi:MAG: NUDIX domain-containing protein [Candidatus Aenigmatarchaeota archaeon]